MVTFLDTDFSASSNRELLIACYGLFDSIQKSGLQIETLMQKVQITPKKRFGHDKTTVSSKDLKSSFKLALELSGDAGYFTQCIEKKDEILECLRQHDVSDDLVNAFGRALDACKQRFPKRASASMPHTDEKRRPPRSALRTKPNLAGALGAVLNDIIVYADSRDILWHGLCRALGRNSMNKDLSSQITSMGSEYGTLQNALQRQDGQQKYFQLMKQQPDAFIEGCNHFLALKDKPPLPDEIAECFKAIIQQEPENWFKDPPLGRQSAAITR